MDGPPSAGEITSWNNGDFTYEPPLGFMDQEVTFNYTVWDTDGGSTPAQCHIDVRNALPEAEDDPRYEGDGRDVPATQSIILDVLANDTDADDPELQIAAVGDPYDPLTLLVHGTREIVTLGDPPKDYIRYTAPDDYVGDIEIGYLASDGHRTDNAVVQLEVIHLVDLRIRDGGPDVSFYLTEDAEVTRGAFTVANLNDTDGDGVDDYMDPDGVIGGEHGFDEVDLMQLFIDKPVPDWGGNVTLQVIGPAGLWEEKTRVTEIPLDWEGFVNIPTSSLPKEVWVEIASPSSVLRDVAISADYHKGGDAVCATGIWAELSAVEDDKYSAAELLADPQWAGMNDPVKTRIQAMGGTGLRPIDLTIGVRNVTLMQFTVQPAEIRSVPGVYFDITRRKETVSWYYDDEDFVTHHGAIDFPLQNEEANDDTVSIDESDEPDEAAHMYVMDSPGMPATPESPDVFCVYQGNFEEFIRVAFGSFDPTDSVNGIYGSRASALYRWHMSHELDNVGGIWVRTTADDPETYCNDVESGHRNLQTSP